MDYVDKDKVKRVAEQFLITHNKTLAKTFYKDCDGEPDFDGDWGDIWSNSEQDVRMGFYVCIPPDAVSAHLKPGKRAPTVVGPEAHILPPKDCNFTNRHRCYRDLAEAKYVASAFSASDEE